MADSLSIKSRDFYEYAGMKMTFSLVLAALGMYSMARLCAAGGQSTYFGIQSDNTSGDAEDSANALAQGFGFGAFFYFLSTVFFWGAAIYISPLIFGSENEKTILKSKQEVTSSSPPPPPPPARAAQQA